jgi:hypothetical protein
MAKAMKENKIEVQKGPRLDPKMKTMKTMTQDQKLAEKHQQNKDWKSAGTLKTHMPKK